MQQPLLILDLDETLIHAKEYHEAHSLPEPDIILPVYYVWKRPHLSLFINTIFAWFDVAVWTSSSASYATAVVPFLFPHPEKLLFLWARNECTQYYDQEHREYLWRKNLDKIKRRLHRPLEQVLILDDSPEKLDRHYGNLIPITSFEGEQTDTELHDILPYLNWIRTVPNVRTIEKRYWRTHKEK